MFNADQNSVSEETGALADQAFERVRELFRTKGLRAGQFVSVHELTRMIDLPLAPTREAVKRAEALGFVTIVPKRGVLIMEATAKSIRECLDMRCIFDQEGARRMIGNLDEKLFEQVRATHVAMVHEAQHSMTIEVQQRAMRIDWQFHMTLSTGLKNPLAESAYALNHERLLILHHTRPLLPDRIVPAFTEHLGIMDAMEKGDVESVYEAVTFHYQNIRRWWSFID